MEKEKLYATLSSNIDWSDNNLIESTKHNRALSIGFLGYIVFIFILTSMTKDLMLFMPDIFRFDMYITNTKFPIIGVYIITSILLTIFHYNVLINLSYHHQKLEMWSKIIETKYEKCITAFSKSKEKATKILTLHRIKTALIPAFFFNYKIIHRLELDAIRLYSKMTCSNFTIKIPFYKRTNWTTVSISEPFSSIYVKKMFSEYLWSRITIIIFAFILPLCAQTILIIRFTPYHGDRTMLILYICIAIQIWIILKFRKTIIKPLGVIFKLNLIATYGRGLGWIYRRYILIGLDKILFLIILFYIGLSMYMNFSWYFKKDYNNSFIWPYLENSLDISNERFDNPTIAIDYYTYHFYNRKVIENRDLSFADMERSTFIAFQFVKVNFQNCNIKNTTFDSCDFRGFNKFDELKFDTNTTFYNCYWDSISWKNFTSITGAKVVSIVKKRRAKEKNSKSYN